MTRTFSSRAFLCALAGSRWTTQRVWKVTRMAMSRPHAVTDALLGSIAAGDIGSFFPPGDPRWKNADSAIFLNLALETLQAAGYRIVNIDTTLILAGPKISPVSGEMRARVADHFFAASDGDRGSARDIPAVP